MGPMERLKFAHINRCVSVAMLELEKIGMKNYVKKFKEFFPIVTSDKAMEVADLFNEIRQGIIKKQDVWDKATIGLLGVVSEVRGVIYGIIVAPMTDMTEEEMNKYAPKVDKENESNRFSLLELD